MAAEALATTPEDLGAADLEPAWQWQFRQMEWGQQREKGWNKWSKKDEGRDWAKPDPKDKPPEGGEVFAAAPAAPGGDPYQVAEATKEEIEAAAARQAEREEEGFHAHLWQEAAQQALADPDRPLCARELVKNGRLTAWWSMSWKDARTQIDGALVDEYRNLLRGYFVGPPDGPGMLPEPVLERCACIFAWFKQNNLQGSWPDGGLFPNHHTRPLLQGASQPPQLIDHLARVAVDERFGSRAAG